MNEVGCKHFRKTLELYFRYIFLQTSDYCGTSVTIIDYKHKSYFTKHPDKV